MTRYLAAAAAAALLYAVLGISVSHVPPGAIDVAGRALAGEAPRLALVFTASCWWPTLVCFSVLALILAAKNVAWRARAIGFVATIVVMWQSSDALKNVFHRPRPGYWILVHEPTYSYSSGHAMFATIVYGALAWFVWRSALPPGVRVVCATLLSLWACGVVWSRLALGAHYVTDLLGGVLLGLTGLALCSAIRMAVRNSREPLTVGMREHGH